MLRQCKKITNFLLYRFADVFFERSIFLQNILKKSELKATIDKVNRETKKYTQKEILEKYKKKDKDYEESVSKFSKDLYIMGYRLIGGYYINTDIYVEFLKDEYPKYEEKDKKIFYSFSIKKYRVFGLTDTNHIDEEEIKNIFVVYIELYDSFLNLAKEISEHITSNFRNILFYDYNDKYIKIEVGSKNTAQNIIKKFLDEIEMIWGNSKKDSIKKNLNLKKETKGKLLKYLQREFGEKDTIEYKSKPSR